MSGYKLSRTAQREVADIVTYFHREISPNVADSIETQLFTAFADLADGRAFGHARNEFAKTNVLFYAAKPYLIIFRKTRATVFVLHVIHGSRDLKRILQ